MVPVYHPLAHSILRHRSERTLSCPPQPLLPFAPVLKHVNVHEQHHTGSAHDECAKLAVFMCELSCVAGAAQRGSYSVGVLHSMTPP